MPVSVSDENEYVGALTLPLPASQEDATFNVPPTFMFPAMLRPPASTRAPVLVSVDSVVASRLVLETDDLIVDVVVSMVHLSAPEHANAILLVLGRYMRVVVLF